MKLASWNVNGLRACLNKGFWEWFVSEQLDIICLQEIKATPEQLEPGVVCPEEYFSYFYPAQKKGYSGVAVYSKKDLGEPLSVQYGLKQTKFAHEGRTLILEYPKFFLFACYFPNGQRDHNRVPFKLEYCEEILKLANEKKKLKEVIICGDFNTAHHPIDLKNPKSNIKTTGFLPIERQWMDKLVQHEFIDIFRKQHPDKEGHYTWWTYRGDCRNRNIGWRIDYFFITAGIMKKCQPQAYIDPLVPGSDHCPILLEANFKAL